MTSAKVQELARDKQAQMQSDIGAREDEIARIRREIGAREAELTKMHVVNHIESAQIQRDQGLIEGQRAQIEELKRELEETRRQLDTVVMTRKSEGTALLEIEHYKADNERLVSMLATTKEFSAFGKLALDT
jgi:hypothetical protein